MKKVDIEIEFTAGGKEVIIKLNCNKIITPQDIIDVISEALINNYGFEEDEPNDNYDA